MKLGITESTPIDYLLFGTLATLRADDDEAKQLLVRLVKAQRDAKRQARRDRRAQKLKRDWT